MATNCKESIVGTAENKKLMEDVFEHVAKNGKIVEMREYCDSFLCETVLDPFPAPIEATVS